MAEHGATEITLERIALIRRLVVGWNGEGAGAPMIHPDAPYGSTDRDGDIANVTGDDEGAEEEHRAVGDAFAAFVRHAVLKPGRYRYHNPLAKLDPGRAGDVFRDGAGATPEHITFDVTDAHLALIPHLAVRWSQPLAVPFIDPERPYGDRPVPEPGPHHEMQPALQIFLRYADIAPGDYA